MMQRCALLLVAGTALHLSLGKVDPSFLAYPWGVIIAVNYLYLLILLRANADKWKWVKGWYDRAAYITSLASMLVLTLLFGLIRQDGSTDGLAGSLGLTQMSFSWIFNLFLLHFTTVMGLKAIDDVWHWRKRKLPNVLIHVSVFVIFTAAIFGSGDKEKVKVTLPLGMPEQMGVTNLGMSARLPFTLTLKEFVLDEYPPHIHLYERETLSPQFVVVDGEGSVGSIGDWQLECVDYLSNAARLSADSGYVDMHHVGATTAVLLKAIHASNGNSIEGWVSCGSHIFAGNALLLPNGSQLVMPQREAKKYLSRVEVSDKKQTRTFDISVNHPATLGPWKIYQSGYDSARGRWSTISVLECVKDGWYTLVHIAMWMILAASALLFVMGWGARKKKKEDKA